MPRPDSSAVVHAQTLRAEDLERLLLPEAGPCVSIYLPTHRKHPDWKQDPVRFRSLVAEAESLLGEHAKVRDVPDLIGPLRRHLDAPYWEYALDGLAVFQSPGFHAAYRLPIPVAEQVVVSETFHTKPLLGFLHSNRRYFVLAVSQNAVSIYEGTSYGAAEVELHSVPASLRDALGIKEEERAVSIHGGRTPGPVFHARGPGREETKDALLRYFRAIDRGLREFLRGERAPLLLAAVGYYHPIYGEANTYPHLSPVGLEGSYERLDRDRIHADAWPLVKGRLDANAAAWSSRYREAAGTGLAIDSIEEIATAVLGGRIRCVLAAEGATAWGILDRTTGAVTRYDRQTGPVDADLIDDLCEEALKRGAEVYVIPQTGMPTQSPIAALLRF